MSLPRLLTVSALALLASTSQAAVSCDTLKTQVSAKASAHGAKNFTLEVLDKDAPTGGKRVVGTCEAGRKKIIYSRK